MACFLSGLRPGHQLPIELRMMGVWGLEWSPAAPQELPAWMESQPPTGNSLQRSLPHRPPHMHTHTVSPTNPDLISGSVFRVTPAKSEATTQGRPTFV